MHGKVAADQPQALSHAHQSETGRVVGALWIKTDSIVHNLELSSALCLANPNADLTRVAVADGVVDCFLQHSIEAEFDVRIRRCRHRSNGHADLDAV
jgi:hypothetical protein